jgi:sialic acid synthase SpsE
LVWSPDYRTTLLDSTTAITITRVAMAATGKPLIISTGMATVAELDETVRAARGAACKDLVLLKCTSTYPATAASTNILTILHLRELFGCEAGLSDHTMGVSMASVELGASIIEKHFTLIRADGDVESTFSMELAELAQLVLESKRAWQALGQGSYGPTYRAREDIHTVPSLVVCGTRLEGRRRVNYR